ncbi:MAG: isoaspartyl peptidase/L-asparaginase [Planctomycetota bacterium]
MLRLLFCLSFFGLPTMTQADNPNDGPIAIAIHGGAGTIRRADMTPEREAAYRGTMEEALRAGHTILEQGGSSTDAVEATIRILEDSPLFNAGRGAVFTAEGRCELDASIMVGDQRTTGAIAGATTIKNPISAARAVMEQTPHVLLAGPAALQAFAEQAQLEQVDNSYFFTDARKKALEAMQQREQDAGASILGIGEGREDVAQPVNEKLGTVGCVALDKSGTLAAGTSTGGLTNKKFGRVGDSPLIGAGTWAENDVVAVSCTGQGEYFIRLQVASDIAARMRYANAPFTDAVQAQMLRIGELDALGGLVAMDAAGNVVYAFNTPGMYRGQINTAGELTTGLYDDEN